MIHFEHLIEKLRALENVRNVDMTSEEFSYTYPGSNLAPIPKMYSQSVDSPETISYELNIDPAIRSKVLALKKTKNPDEAIVYNPDTKNAEIINKSETNDYVQRGFKVIYEEANVAPVPGPAGSRRPPAETQSSTAAKTASECSRFVAYFRRNQFVPSPPPN